MSKFLSLTLWGFVTYMCLYYIDFILMYNLQEDLVAYNHLLHGAVNSWEQIGALGLQGIGSNCMYAMGMLVGAYIIRFRPGGCLMADSRRHKQRRGIPGRVGGYGRGYYGRFGRWIGYRHHCRTWSERREILNKITPYTVCL